MSDIELIRREGWDTPAAEYWSEQAHRFMAERDAARAELHRVRCALQLAVMGIDGVEAGYHPKLRASAPAEEGRE